MKQKATIIAKMPATVIARNEAISELCQSGNGHIVLSKMPLLFVLVFCFLISLNTLAQSKNNTKKDTSKISVTLDAPRDPKSKPLIILDDSVYKGDISGINPGDINDVTVLKDNDAVAKYGAKASNGVIIITTKRYKKADTIANIRSLDSVVDKDAVYVIDGKVSRNKLSNLDPKDILTVVVLKNVAKDPSLTNGVSSEIIIVTKQGAVKSYQKKFSAFSITYKDYLEKHAGDDNNLVYILNGSPIQGKRDQIIKTLYNVSPGKIKNVDFNQSEIDKEHGTAAVIINLEDIIINIR